MKTIFTFISKQQTHENYTHFRCIDDKPTDGFFSTEYSKENPNPINHGREWFKR